jgi:hypothetical protein
MNVAPPLANIIFDLVEGPGTEVGGSHSRRERTAGMFDDGAVDAHGVGPPVHRLD